MIELDQIDKKAASVLDGYLVRKDLVRTFSRQFPVPTYVVEFMLGRYCASTDQEEIDEGLEIVQRQLKYRTVRAGQEDERLRTLIGELVAFTTLHFATERRFMERYDFPDMAAHRNEHEDFELRNRRYVERFEPGDELRLLQMTKDWLADHIQGPDKILGAYLRSKGAS